MEYKMIKLISDRYFEQIEPYILKGMVAGSIRRKKAEPNDIELVLVLNPDKIEEIKELVDTWGTRIKGQITGRYTQRLLTEDVKIDIFLAQLSNYGNIVVIRTGNWRFSRFMMGIRAPQVNLKHREGYLWHGMGRLNCYEEEDVFRLLRMDYIDPENRSWK